MKFREFELGATKQVLFTIGNVELEKSVETLQIRLYIRLISQIPHPRYQDSRPDAHLSRHFTVPSLVKTQRRATIFSRNGDCPSRSNIYL